METGTYPMAISPVERDAQGIAANVYASIDGMIARFTNAEAFDKFELEGDVNGSWQIDPLVRTLVNTGQTGGNWYRDNIESNVYKRFSSDESIFKKYTHRENEPLGFIPIGSAQLGQENIKETPELNTAIISMQMFSQQESTMRLSYEFPYEIYRDNADFRNQVLSYSQMNELTPDLKEYMKWRMPALISGQYRVDFVYVLPGEEPQNAPIVDYLDFEYFRPSTK